MKIKGKVDSKKKRKLDSNWYQRICILSIQNKKKYTQNKRRDLFMLKFYNENIRNTKKIIEKDINQR